jgi:hypothetical protein
MIYKLEKIDRVISSIVRKLQISNEEIPDLDFIEWIAEGMEHIGSYYQMEEKSATVIIDNYKGLLPCDLHEMIRIDWASEVKPPNGGGFYGGSFVDYLTKAGVDFDSMNAYDRYRVLPMGMARPENYGLGEYQGSGLEFNSKMVNPEDKFTDRDYNINFDKINTSFKSGFLHVRYLAIPIDERGFPLIPDSQSYRDALFWRCAYMCSIGRPDLLKSDQMKNIEFTENRWHFYCAQAGAKATAPNLQMIERIKNNFMRLMNTVDDDSTNYSSLGKKQIINFNGTV